MDYNFKEIEAKWQKEWKENKTYQVDIKSDKPKYYVLDMFPYPSGAGLHVGHPLGYIASDIYARYKRLKGFNVLHPMGYDAYGLPAEQYAIQTGQHPAITTEQNIARYREQLDKIGFSFDWEREIRTCNPDYYKWTQWAFIQMFNSYYCNQAKQARSIAELVECFESQGNKDLDIAQSEELHFTADEWKAWDEKKQQETLMNYRIAYLADTMVNWCAELGTVLANDEVQDGMSIRGGYPVEQRKMRQWCLRVSAYAERLLNGLDTLDWTDSLKETQRNWIGRSEGAEIWFSLAHSHPTPPLPEGEGESANHEIATNLKMPYAYATTNKINWKNHIDNARTMRQHPTEAESILWNMIRSKKIGYRFRRQHLIDKFIVDFICLEKKLIIEVDGGYHDTEEQKEYDHQRTLFLNENGYKVLRFKNEEVANNVYVVVEKIKIELEKRKSYNDIIDTDKVSDEEYSPSFGGGWGVVVFTTRPDTIYGVTFMVLAPESELVSVITTAEQKTAVEEYLSATKNRTERERLADKRVSGVFSGSYAVNPISGVEIPIWISDYVLAGYGTGAIMAVPAHDSRDYAFARHFNLPVIPLIEGADVSQESFDAKEGTMINSPIENKEQRAKTTCLYLMDYLLKRQSQKQKNILKKTIWAK
jgi:leucyl-tRNA synthetase